MLVFLLDLCLPFASNVTISLSKFVFQKLRLKQKNKLLKRTLKCALNRKKRRERFALKPDKGVKCNTALFPIYPVQQAVSFGLAK